MKRTDKNMGLNLPKVHDNMYLLDPLKVGRKACHPGPAKDTCHHPLLTPICFVQWLSHRKPCVPGPRWFWANLSHCLFSRPFSATKFYLPYLVHPLSDPCHISELQLLALSPSLKVQFALFYALSILQLHVGENQLLSEFPSQFKIASLSESTR